MWESAKMFTPNFMGPLEDRVAIAELNGTYADGVVRFDADTWASV